MSKVAQKPREYTADKPLVIQIIERSPGVWTIEPEPGQHGPMRKRLKDPDPDRPGMELQDRILKEWKERKGKKPQPPFLDPAEPEHVPIIIREGEFVRFKCEKPLAFEIFAEKHELVDPDPNAPPDPFGWNGRRSVDAKGSISASVVLPAVDEYGNPTQACPRTQGFYKFRALVDPDGARIDVDPCGYIDH
jgi:hypothetical protein